MVNAWGRGDALPESTDKKRRFGVEVVFVGKDKDGKEVTDVHYTNFSPDILDWQFLSDVYVAKIEYTSVKVSTPTAATRTLHFSMACPCLRRASGRHTHTIRTTTSLR